MEFGLLAPEINSGRMHTGPGSGPMIAAAAAWDDVAAGLHSTAASFSSVISGLTVGWQGASSAMMAAAAAPYLVWMSATASQAEQTAIQARAAVAAYETAFAATVPPSVVAANRSVLMTLTATNFLGQNTPAIAATEADYAEMWAQDAAAMYSYAGSSATASSLTPFNPPPQTTNPAGTAGQAAAVAQASGLSAQSTLPQLVSGAPQTLHNLATMASTTAADPSSPTTLLQAFSFAEGAFNPTRLYDPFGAFYNQGLQNFLAPFNNFNMQRAYADALGGVASAAGGAGPGMRVGAAASGAVSAGMGRAGFVGNLAVPQGWASAAPAIRPVAAVLAQTSLGSVPAAVAADGQGTLFGSMALSGLAGRAVAGTGGSVAVSTAAGAGSGGAGVTATIIVIPED